MAFYPPEPDQIQDASGNLINPSKEDGHLATIDSHIPPQGQTTSAASLPVVIASDQSAIPTTSAPNFGTRSDTFTTTGNGTTVDKHTAPVTMFTVEVKGTGASATTWDVRLEGSLDGINFTQILQHTNTTGDGTQMMSGSLRSPSLYFRSRVASLSLGSATNIVVTILGL